MVEQPHARVGAGKRRLGRVRVAGIQRLRRTIAADDDYVYAARSSTTSAHAEVVRVAKDSADAEVLFTTTSAPQHLGVDGALLYYLEDGKVFFADKRAPSTPAIVYDTTAVTGLAVSAAAVWMFGAAGVTLRDAAGMRTVVDAGKARFNGGRGAFYGDDRAAAWITLDRSVMRVER